MDRTLYYFRPGEEVRMLARCQFGINREGRCGATLTYPIKGHPWRRNVVKSYQFEVSPEAKALMFAEVERIRTEHPSECLRYEQLWNDSSEKANGILRDRSSGKLCYSIAILQPDGPALEQYALREDSAALLNSRLYQIVAGLIAPYEKLE